MDVLAETIKGFKVLTLQSKINDYSYYHSEEDIAERDPKSDPLVATHTSDVNKRKITDTDTTQGNSPQKSLTNREIPAIIQGLIPSVNQTTADGVATSGSALYTVCVFFHKDIFTCL